MNIEAMKQALEVLETLGSGDTYKTHNAATALRKAIEQSTEQEPSRFTNKENWQSGNGRIWSEMHKAEEDFPVYTSPPQRQPLEGVTDVYSIGYHSLQLVFKSQDDIAKFKAAHGIKDNT